MALQGSKRMKVRGCQVRQTPGQVAKIVNFMEGKNDLNSWLTQFERFAEVNKVNKWSRVKWASSLNALLTGRALDYCKPPPRDQAGGDHTLPPDV
ncbi:hypothetical protein PoB_006923900 [Plakobranchus ocellatus]|uniref:Uncharacterized protein n=1 Tax=Plakobranchus ocellatus TaxID=259542 RepID=A0AAV4DF53_9GAST|nr:hypothetical protein PoB_006923900 [Plakobranchus ocellatus]